MTRILLPCLLGPVLVVLILVPVGFMFVGAVLSGGLLDPESHLTLDKLSNVYTTLPYLKTVASTLAIAPIGPDEPPRPSTMRPCSTAMAAVNAPPSSRRIKDTSRGAQLRRRVCS